MVWGGPILAGDHLQRDNASFPFHTFMHDCFATEPVDSCSPEGRLRLVGWPSDGAGRIEICRDGVWGTVCADSRDTPWSEKNAQVACRALGYSGALNSILHST